MADAIPVELHASGAETADDSGAAVDIGAQRTCVKLSLVVTQVTEPDSMLTVRVETGPSATGPWREAYAFDAQDSPGKVQKTIADLDQFVRAAWTLTGNSPSFTFSLGGEGHTLYASPRDLERTSLKPEALAGIPPDVLADCCLRATSDGERAVNSSYELPLVAWGEDLRGIVADRAAFYAICRRGLNPESEADQVVMMNGGVVIDGKKTSAQKVLDDIASGAVKPIGIVDQTPETFEASEAVVSAEPRRGW